MTDVPPAPAVPRARWHLPRPTLVWAVAVAWAVAVTAQARLTTTPTRTGPVWAGSVNSPRQAMKA